MLCHSIYLQVVKVHLFDIGLPMNRYTLVLPSENQNAFACSPSAQMPFIMKYSQSRTSRRSELLIFAKIYYFETLKYVDEFSELKKITRLKKNPSLSLSLYLLICRCTLIFPKGCLSLSFSLYLHLQKQFGSRSDPNGIQERMFRQFKNLCM